jgi:hypothetical protein
MVRQVALISLVAILGCFRAPEHVAIPPAPASFKPRQQIEVWQDQEAMTLQGVRIRGDSLIGVPFWRPPGCDSCRVTIPLNRIDSLRTVHNERAGLVAASLPILALATVAVIFAVSGGSD